MLEIAITEVLENFLMGPVRPVFLMGPVRSFDAECRIQKDIDNPAADSGSLPVQDLLPVQGQLFVKDRLFMKDRPEPARTREIVG